jgi:hypothetical protein
MTDPLNNFDKVFWIALYIGRLRRPKYLTSVDEVVPIYPFHMMWT